MQKFLSVFKNSFFWLLLVLVVFIPLYPKFPLLNIPGTYVAARLEDFFMLVVMVFWLLINISKISDYLKQPIYLSFMLFWAIGLLSLISALTIIYFVSPHLGVLHYLRRIEYMSLFIIAATSIESLKQVKIILKVFLVVTLVIIFYGFGQQWLNFPVISTTNREFSKGLILFLSPEARVNSTFAGHYDLAAYLTAALIILGSLFFIAKSWFSKLVIMLVGGLSFVLLGMTAARASFIATLLGVALTFWLNQKMILIIVLFVLAIAAVGLIPELRHRLVATVTVNLLGGGGPKYNLPEGVVLDPGKRLTEEERIKILEQIIISNEPGSEKISTIASDLVPGEPVNPTELGVHRSFGIRLNVEWPRALNAFYKNPFLGTGYSSISIATDNDLLRSLGEVGLLGTLSFVLILWILFKQMWRFIKISSGFEKNFIIGVFSSLIAIILTSMYIDLFEASKIAILLWFFLGISWAVIRGYK